MKKTIQIKSGLEFMTIEFNLSDSEWIEGNVSATIFGFSSEVKGQFLKDEVEIFLKDLELIKLQKISELEFVPSEPFVILRLKRNALNDGVQVNCEINSLSVNAGTLSFEMSTFLSNIVTE